MLISTSNPPKKQLMGNALISVNADTEMPERDPNDHYPTAWSVIEHAMGYLPGRRNSGGYRAGDLGAGSGRWGQVFKTLMPFATLYGYEKQCANPLPEVYDQWVQGDALQLLQDFRLQFDVLFGNPPFVWFSKGFVKQFFLITNNRLKDSGVLVLLGRSAISETVTRYEEIFRWWPPKYEIVLVNRTSFYPEGHPRCGGTNATAHSIFVWVKGYQGDTIKRWAPNLVNDNRYRGIHKGTNTWADMIKLGLVPPEESIQTEDKPSTPDQP